MTRKPVQTPIDRKTLAAELRQLADQLDRGALEVEQRTVPVGEPLFRKTKRKVKDDRAYLTFSCKIAIATPPSAAESAATKPTPAKQRPDVQGTPAAAKIMKKEIARLWKELGGRIGAAAQPAAADMAKLRRLFAEYQLYAPAAWADDWQRCVTAVGRCLDAAAASDFAAARRLIDAIDQQTKTCHKLHK